MLCFTLAAAALAPQLGRLYVHQPEGVRVSTPPRLAIESAASLETQFAAVKAATLVAQDMAPALVTPPTMRRKRDVMRGAFQKAGLVLSLRKDASDAVREIVDESCDVDAPEVCTDESIYKQTVGNLVGLLVKTLRMMRGDATEAELADAGDAMEAGWESKAQGSALKRTTEVWAFLGRAALKVRAAQNIHPLNY